MENIYYNPQALALISASGCGGFSAYISVEGGIIMPLTLKDIAKIVGVAESTVSRAINNKPGVGEETRERIMEIVREYNYKPNQLAQGLAKNQTHLLALLISDLNKPGYTQIIEGVESVANQAGYQVILCNTTNNLEKEKTYLELVEREQVDGAIIVGGELADKNILNLALDEGKLVLVNRLAEEMLIPTVLIDSSKGAYLATEHLLEQGLDRVAIIMGSDESYLESEKLDGYKKALSKRNVPVKEEYIYQTDGSREQGFQAFLSFMEQEEFPQAFFVSNDLLAVGLIEAIKMGGYLIPDDFAIVGYGETLISSIVTPPLSVVAEPLNQLGIQAARYLITLLDDLPLDEMIKVLEPVINIKESSVPNIKGY